MYTQFQLHKIQFVPKLPEHNSCEVGVSLHIHLATNTICHDARELHHTNLPHFHRTLATSLILHILKCYQKTTNNPRGKCLAISRHTNSKPCCLYSMTLTHVNIVIPTFISTARYATINEKFIHLNTNYFGTSY